MLILALAFVGFGLRDARRSSNFSAHLMGRAMVWAVLAGLTAFLAVALASNLR
jgi:hypothetical protein